MSLASDLSPSSLFPRKSCIKEMVATTMTANIKTPKTEVMIISIVSIKNNLRLINEFMLVSIDKNEKKSRPNLKFFA